MGELDGKVAVITGAGSGMARASTHVFVREGAKVLAADISGRENDTAAELGDAVVPFHCDVTQESDVEAMFAAALREFGRVDAVLNVAGIGGAQPLAKVTMDEYDRIMAVDLKGVLLGTKHGINAMLPTGGGVDRELVVDRGHERVGHADERLLGREGRRHLVHQVGRGRVRGPGHPRQRDLPRPHRDRALGRPGGDRPLPGARGERGAQARRSTRGGGGARRVPRVGPRRVSSPAP